MPNESYDFSGWASRYDIPCSDGKTIRKGAFSDMDGMVVPLVWGHEHGTPLAVLGNALIEHREEGPYIYGRFNDSEEGKHAREAVKHKDVKYLSIYANRLKKNANDILHGVIREVSLVYGGANPGAYIDNAVLEHSDGTYDTVEDEAIISTGYEINLEEVMHADSKKEESMAEEKKEEKKEETKSEKTVQDVFDELTEEQKDVVYFLIGEAVKNANEEGDKEDVEHSEEGVKQMKYNAFEGVRRNPNVLTHSDQEEILNLAKDNRVGTFKNAMHEYMAENFIQHDDEPAAEEDPIYVPTAAPVAGFDAVNNMVGESITSFNAILPEYKDLHSGAPELITNDQGWVTTVMGKTHKSPISRIRTGQVDIRAAEAMADLRAKGYQKGNKKAYTGNIKLARRTTDPQTIYVKNALHRDDIIDITDFDYVQYLYNIDRMMLNEEVATAIMFGDGREDGDPDKIFPEHIRPIWLDDELYTLHKDLQAPDEIQGSETDSYFGENYMKAESMVNTVLYAMEDFRGSGTPDMFITPHMLNVMLLARDRNGRRIYSSKAELASSFNVGNIYTVEQMKNKTRTVSVNGSDVTKKLVCLIVNLNDYQVGSTKGGEVTHFTQFDIDFNQQKSLLETRISGALVKIQSAIAIEETVTT